MASDTEELVAALRGSLVENERLRRQNRRLLGSLNEPIAIVGLGCRFPGGVRGPEQFWELLATGADAVSGFPPDRGWDAGAPGSVGLDGEASGAAQGGFVYDAGDFDPGFFGISPREALAMDPQQRLLLETSWEALERAGIEPRSLRGSRTGVFCGGTATGYGAGLEGSGSENFLLTGTATAVLSGRVSYALGLEGPSVTVDTACSSSLVTLHLAAQALRSGECSLALASGVTVMATPGAFAEFARQQGLASDGRCKSFSADADGTGWGEGAAVLVLERLSDARRNGHHVRAVVRGSAVNQDGASNGLTAPNGPSQQRVIRAALAQAGLSAGDVDVVEAHGTGTVLGDPIEAQAVLATYGQDRPEGRPLWLGSVKPNIAHTQAAAGAAGVIKMVLALEHGLLPRSLHVREPSPHVDWSAGQVQLLAEQVPWPAGESPRRAGVSAFGISGTNAHVIIEEARHVGPGAVSGSPDGGEASAAATADRQAPVLVGGPSAWLISGRTESALAAQAGRLAGFVRDRPELSPADVAWSLATTRSMFAHRAVVMGGSRAELLTELDTVAAKRPTSRVVSGVARGNQVGLVGFLFAGQGAQRGGMGRELYAASPVFAAAFDRAVGVLEVELGLAIRDVVLGDSEVADRVGPSDRGEEESAAARADQTLFAQTGLFAVEVGLLAVLAEAGIRPDVVAGHSVGEIAAAYAAGVLSLEDAAALVAARARLMQGLPSGGAMAAVSASEAEVQVDLEDVAGVSLAAVNGPGSVVVSGDAAAVDSMVERWRERGRRVRRLRVSHAFHSARMDPVLRELGEVAAGLEHSMPAVSWVAALSGALVEVPEAGYWAAQARQPVRFSEAVSVMAELGVSVFLEIGPDATLSGMGSAALADAGGSPGEDAEFIPMLRPKTPAATSILTSLGRAHVRGAAVDWTAVLPVGHPIALPTYAFDRQHFWAAPAPVEIAADGAGQGGSEAETLFWAAVEQGDLAGFADALDVAEKQPFSEVLPVLTSWRRREREESAVAGWRYRISWVPLRDSEPVRLSGRWLVVTGPTGRALLDDVVSAMTARGARVVLVVTAPVTDAAEVSRAALTARIGRALTEPSTCGDSHAGPVDPDDGLAGVLSLLALDEAELADHPEVSRGLAGSMSLVQALGDAGVGAALWIATRGAVAVGDGEVLAHPVQAQVWGLGRVVGLEHPDRWGGLIDLPTELDERAGARLGAVLAGYAEDQVAIRPAGIYGRRLTRARRPVGSGHSGAVDRLARGTVLVTGGTGAIGARLADWLAARGTVQVVLTSRSGPGAQGVARLAARLAEAGTAVAVLTGDVARRDDVAGLLGWIASEAPPLTGVMHTAGVLDDGVLDRMTPERLAGVLAPKAGGAWHLHELTAGLDLSAFVLFSSSAATMGGGGQSNYAAANAFLDALAEHRSGRGLAATALAWGAWAGGGMAQSDARVWHRVGGGPTRALDPDRALRVMGQALSDDQTALAVMDLDWAKVAAALGDVRQVPLLRELADVHALVSIDGRGPQEHGREVGHTAGVAALVELAGLPAEEQDRRLRALVRGQVAAVLGHSDGDQVGDRTPLRELGFDSLTAVELRNTLATVTGLVLPTTLIFDHPTTAALAAYLRAALAPPAADPIARLTEDIDRIETNLTQLSTGSDERDQLVDRLRGVLSRVGGAGTRSSTAALASAGADELYEFIDKQLGL